MVRHLDGAFARIWTLSPEEDVLVLQASAGLYTHTDGPHSRVPVGRSTIGLIAQERRPHLTNAVLGDPRVHDREGAGREGLVAFAGYPLVVEDRVVGVMAMIARHPLSEASLQAMAAAANEIALGIERKRAEVEILRLNEHLKRRLRQIKALRRIDAAITSSPRPVSDPRPHRRASDRPTRSGCRRRPALRRGGRDAGVRRRSRHLPRGSRSRLPGSGGLARRVAQEGCPLHVPDLAHAPVPDDRVHWLLEERFVTYHAIPLEAEGRVKGVLECFHRAPTEPDAEWLCFARILAGQAAVAIDNAALFEGLRRSNEELRAAYDATIEGWSRALDLRDKETEGHSRRVTEMALHLARVMGLGEPDLIHIRRGALLHDIGKLGVPDAILHKPGPLTEEEWVAMRRHPSYAVEILGPVQFLGPALDVPHYHHERRTGPATRAGSRGNRFRWRRGSSRRWTSGMRGATTARTAEHGRRSGCGSTSAPWRGTTWIPEWWR